MMLTAEHTSLLMQLADRMCEWETQVPDRIHHFIKVHGFSRQIGLREGLDEHTQFIL